MLYIVYMNSNEREEKILAQGSCLIAEATRPCSRSRLVQSRRTDVIANSPAGATSPPHAPRRAFALCAFSSRILRISVRIQECNLWSLCHRNAILMLSNLINGIIAVAGGHSTTDVRALFFDRLPSALTWALPLHFAHVTKYCCSSQLTPCCYRRTMPPPSRRLSTCLHFPCLGTHHPPQDLPPLS